jgi:hypothetical protein
MNTISIPQLRELLRYDAETGRLIWIARPSGSRSLLIGSEAGNVNLRGYTYVRVLKKKFLKHRLCWALIYGEWPNTWIDHIDGDPSNNMLANLRLATPSQNNQNRRATSNTGVKGVHTRGDGTYVAQICHQGKRMYLGAYAEISSAIAARAAAEIKFHSHRKQRA